MTLPKEIINCKIIYYIRVIQVRNRLLICLVESFINSQQVVEAIEDIRRM